MKNVGISNKNLLHRIEWNLTIQTISPLRIGPRSNDDQSNSKESERAGTELHALYTSNGSYFIIPGSSVRGVFRQHLEHIVSILKGTGNDGKMVESIKFFEDQVITYLFGQANKKDEDKEVGRKGRLWIGDGYLPKKENYYVKNMTPIDRITHRPIAPLKIESIRRGASFTIKMVIENAKMQELGLIALLLRDLFQAELSLGSGTSRGLGNIQLQSLHTKMSLFYRDKNHELVTLDNQSIPISQKEWDREENGLWVTYEHNAKNTQDLLWLQPAVNSLRTLSAAEVDV